jgi:hypothetical protein
LVDSHSYIFLDFVGCPLQIHPAQGKWICGEKLNYPFNRIPFC